MSASTKEGEGVETWKWCVTEAQGFPMHWLTYAVLGLSTLSHAELGKDAAARFWQEAPEAWTKYSAQAQRLQGTIKHERSITLDGQPLEGGCKEFLEWKANEHCRLLLETSQDGPDAVTNLWAMNPKYVFALRRASPSEPWVVTLVEGLSNAAANHVRTKLDVYQRCSMQLIVVDREALPEVVIKKEFNAIQIAKVHRLGRELAEVKFNYPHSWNPDHAASYIPVQGGTLLLDPQRYWTLASLEVNLRTLAGSGVRTMSFDVEELEGKVPVIKKCVVREDWTLASNQRMSITSISENNFSLPMHLPRDEEFRLSAFGFPEPPGVEWKQPTPLWLWVAGAAFACLILGGVFSWLRSRAAARRSAP